MKDDELEIESSDDICSVCGNFRENCTCGDDYTDDATVTAKLEAMQEGAYSPPDDNSPHGYILGRPIIARDTEINGGAFAFNHEAIVVDDTKNELIRSCWEELKSLLDEKIQQGASHKEDIFQTVLWFVIQKMPYKLKEVDKIDSVLRKDRKGWYKVPLDQFILKGAGVCRHEALLAGYLMEKMTKEHYISPKDGKTKRYLRGKASVERSINRNKQVGHAWATYTTKAGEKVIVDPANLFIGTFDRTEEERLKRKNQGRLLWYYEGVSKDDPEETEDPFIYGATGEAPFPPRKDK